ncbi:bifunctional riboflavin kinase/FAD synthetase [Paenibacillus sp. MBLB4367]|uniref:bifunctional riboflavin kinase/FAD synthetase n=1 Tax=Paenibacillus sp. MBLB4367 TaxID=3384767 RepID=UPI0039080E81
MNVYTLSYPFELPASAVPEAQVLALGDFDGIHLGHQEVIRRAIGTAQKLNIPASIMTFDPHPRVILGHSKYEQSLTPLDDKLALMEKLGVASVYIVRFDSAFSKLSPEAFVDQVLCRLAVQTVVVGFDFRFGHQGEGTADSLGLLGKGRFAVEVVRPFHMDGDKVSSTLVREFLQDGDTLRAEQLMGRLYTIKGTVVEGDKRGRTIGFPTANIDAKDAYVLPKRGVYAVRAQLGSRKLGGVMNIGLKPTFVTGELKPTIEVHLFDFDETIYGRELTVQVLDYLREEVKFGSVDELVHQIQRDAQTARERLASRHE